MTWVWHTAGPEVRALMLTWIEEAGLEWTPPAPLVRPELAPQRTLWQRRTR